VVIFNDRMEVNLRPGAVLVEEAQKFAEIEKNWGLPCISANFDLKLGHDAFTIPESRILRPG